MSTLPDPKKTFAEQQPLTLLAMCIFGEARGQSMAAKIGQASVVHNRVKDGRFGHDWEGVILHPYQFSCFNENDPNREKLLQPLAHESPKVWVDCVNAATVVMNDAAHDTTQGALYYHSYRSAFPPPPAWGKVTFTLSIDGLHFFKETHDAQ